MSFLRLQSLTKRYGELLAVDDMTLEVKRGEFVSLLGPSGCGKTTTLQMVAGFAEATSGSIEMDGRDITSLAPQKRNIGIVFQSYALFPHLSVTENVRFGLEMRRIRNPERQRRTKQALELVRLDHLGDRYPRELSGGQQQRVALARALVIEPPLLLLDEPLSNLDAKLREDMQLELRAIQQKVGTTTLMVTHDQNEALSMSERVVIMSEGRTIQVAAPFDAYEAPASVFVSTFVGKTNLLDADAKNKDDDGRYLYVNNCFIGQCNEVQTGGTGAVTVSVRPERVKLTGVGNGMVDGRIAACQFPGNQWLYQIESSIGSLLSTCPNSGRPDFGVGDAVGVNWAAEAIRVLPAAARPAADS
jgi:putative spermidine/putrescine transport system ATP-binding protein